MSKLGATIVSDKACQGVPWREHFDIPATAWHALPASPHILTHAVTSSSFIGTQIVCRGINRLSPYSMPLKWHDLARHIAGHCWDKIRASVRLAILLRCGVCLYRYTL